MTNDILAILAGLAGLGGFISILVNVLKAVGVIKDGTSEGWFQAFNLVAFIAVAVVYFVKIPVDWSMVDDWLNLGMLLLGYILQIASGEFTYKTLKGKVPLIGFTFDE